MHVINMLLIILVSLYLCNVIFIFVFGLCLGKHDNIDNIYGFYMVKKNIVLQTDYWSISTLKFIYSIKTDWPLAHITQITNHILFN